MIVIVVELSGTLYFSIDGRLAQVTIITNSSWGQDLNMPPAHLGQEVIRGRLCLV